MRRSALAAAVFLGMVLGSRTVSSQPVHDEIRPKLVFLHARGLAASGPNTGAQVDSYATGSLVSDDGLVLTVHHLISELGEVVPETVTIDAHIEEKTANARAAAVVDASIPTDLMLLKIPPAPGARTYPSVFLGSARDHDDSQDIYTSGFPAATDSDDIKDQGRIQARSGPGGYLWRVNMKFEGGQSGSPVYNADGQILGVVKGERNDRGYIIPIEFAESLLAQIRLRDIRAKMKDFEVLRKQFDWYGELDRDSRKITIIYEKSVGGKPDVDSIKLKITPVGEKDGKLDQRITEFPLRPIKLTAKSGLSGGVFELADLWEKVEQFRKDFDFQRITRLEVKIVPTLTDGSELRRKTITVDY